LRGRDFDETDVAGRPPSTLISASLAKQFWPNENPIGKHITLTFFGTVREVVGVVGDVKSDGLDQNRPPAMLYVPLGQLSAPSAGGWRSFSMTLVVRSSAKPASLVSAVSNAVHDVDRNIPVRNVLTMDELVTTSLSQQRFNLMLLGAFAVLSYSVRRRVQEIGIRLALGARISDVLRMIVIEGMRPTLLGVTIGIVGALALGQVMSSLIYGVKPTDPLTFLAVAMVLAVVALSATIIPAYRAARVDPMVALRYE
jgi:hypothetical protein